MDSQQRLAGVNDDPDHRQTDTLSSYEFASAELTQWLSYMVRRADRDITRKFLVKFGYDQAVPPVALSMLMLIGATPGLDQHDLALALDMDKANAARLIRSLDEAGWLLRRQQTNDHRKQGVYLTPSGVMELGKLKRSMREFERELAATFSEQELETLLQLLGKLHIRTKHESRF